MGYQVLARKWRPHNFEALVGQDHILQALTNALNNNKVHHAYLFTGTRGVGKTTIARIFAKCLNCEQGVSAKPCGQCNSCREVDQGNFIDLIEVDAASRTKVEDTREILDNVQYAPVKGAYKIYLIDEVHMLSTHSFNALLKTLEEPPAHVKFILATTDPQKLPITILSRCLRFNLKLMTTQNITKHLENVLTKEGVSFEKSALSLLAYAAEGSMRDALSLTDQAIAFCNNELTEAKVSVLLGTVNRQHLLNILDAMAVHDVPKTLSIVAVLAEQGVNYAQALEGILSILHKVAIIQLCPDTFNADEDHKLLLKLAREISPEDIQLFYQSALISRRDLSLAPNSRIGFEMALLRMLIFRPVSTATLGVPDQENNVTQVIEKNIPEQKKNDTSDKLCSDRQRNEQNLQLDPQQIAENVDQIIHHTTIHHTTDDFLTKKLNLPWYEILPELQLTGLPYALAANSALKKITETEIVLVLDPTQEVLLNDVHKASISEAFKNWLNRNIVLQINVEPLNQLETYVMRNNRLAIDRQCAVEAHIKSSPEVNLLIESFNGKVVPQTIKSV